MNLSNLELFSTDKQKEIIDRMSITERAEIKHWPNYLTAKRIRRFPDYLSIEDIGNLLFPIPAWTLKPDDKNLLTEWKTNRKKQIKCNHAFKDQLIDMCKNGNLSYKAVEYVINKPAPSQNQYIGSVEWHTRDSIFCSGNRDMALKKDISNLKYFTINKNELKRYYESIDKWPLINKGLLAGWWTDNPGKKSSEPKILIRDKRLISLKDFVACVRRAKGETNSLEEPYYFPCKIETIFSALKDWETQRCKKKVINRDDMVWTIEPRTFKKDFWENNSKRKEICDGKGYKKAIDDNYFKNLKLHDNL